MKEHLETGGYALGADEGFDRTAAHSEAQEPNEARFTQIEKKISDLKTRLEEQVDRRLHAEGKLMLAIGDLEEQNQRNKVWIAEVDPRCHVATHAQAAKEQDGLS